MARQTADAEGVRVIPGTTVYCGVCSFWRWEAGARAVCDGPSRGVRGEKKAAAGGAKASRKTKKNSILYVVALLQKRRGIRL
jgi:hypothetical protein